MVWYGMMWYGYHPIVWYGYHTMVWYGYPVYGMLTYGMVWYGSVGGQLPRPKETAGGSKPCSLDDSMHLLAKPVPDKTRIEQAGMNCTDGILKPK